MGAGDTLTSTPNDTQHSLVRLNHVREYCDLFPPKYALPISWPVAELGVLVSNLPAEKPTISLPRVTARCRAKIVRAAALFSTANHSRLSAQDVSSDVKFPSGSSKHGLSCTRAHLQLASPSQLPEMPIAWFQICFRCGQDGPRRCPALHSFSVFAYRFCDSDKSASANKVLLARIAFWASLFPQRGMLPVSIGGRVYGLDARTQSFFNRHISTRLTVCT